ncbi:MAG: RNA polymerase sigma-70 factor [Odoribacteraceae bacterium]|jgi:RNA polymerase sigma-70 factor (ECF subfamily)|nr:RNA polymerase sigma-70 factor [Odoribacteraceae bacterium]
MSIDPNICTEKELLARVAAGDERAFRRLFDCYQPRVYSFAMYVTRSAFLAEEIVQEVFMKVWIARRELAGVDYFIAYLKTIARNVASNHLKRVAHERVIMQNMFAETSPPRSVTEEEVIVNEFQCVLEDAIASLPPRQREVYLLHRCDHLKQEEIAERLGLSLHTVKEYMKKALSAIRVYVERRVDVMIMIALQEFFR